MSSSSANLGILMYLKPPPFSIDFTLFRAKCASSSDCIPLSRSINLLISLFLPLFHSFTISVYLSFLSPSKAFPLNEPQPFLCCWLISSMIAALVSLPSPISGWSIICFGLTTGLGQTPCLCQNSSL